MEIPIEFQTREPKDPIAPQRHPKHRRHLIRLLCLMLLIAYLKSGHLNQIINGASMHTALRTHQALL